MVTSYTCLKPGSSHVAVGLCNLTGKNIILKPNMIIAKISAANVVPHMLAPKNPIDTESEQTTSCLSKLYNTIEEVIHSDDLE